MPLEMANTELAFDPKPKCYKALAEALYAKPWMATAEAVETLHELLSERRAGLTLTDEEIRLRVEAAGGSKKNRLRELLKGGPAASFFDDGEEEGEPYAVVGGIAIIPLAGTLFAKANLLTKHSGCTSYQEFQANVAGALSRSDVRRIILHCDTPGGQVAGCKDVADWLYAQRGGSKPIDAYIYGQCCSAGLYVASAARRMIASPSSLIGSVGTLILVRDTSEAHARFGVAAHVLRSSPLKAAGIDGEKFDGAKKQSLQKIVDQFGGEFESDLGKYRGVSAATVRETFGQGAVFTPKEALAVGMIDQVATWDEFFTPLAQSSAPTSGRDKGGSSMKYSQQIRAALLAQGFIGAMDASDEVVAAALAGLGVSAESPTIDAINQKLTERFRAQLPVTTPAAAAPAAAGAPDQQAIEQRAAQAEKNRITGLMNARSQMAKLNVAVSDQQFDAAVADTKIDAAAATLAWTNQAAALEPAITRPSTTGGITAGPSQYDKWLPICLQAIAQRAGGPKAQDPRASKLANQRLASIARMDLKERGVDTEGMSEADVMKTWAIASAHHGGEVPVDSDPKKMLVANAYTGPGAFPSALGGVMNTIFLGLLPAPQITYPQWSQQLNDAPDFRPQTLFSLGGDDEFDLNMTAKDPKQADIGEETGFIDNAIYDKQFIWTPVMIANDNGALKTGVDGLWIGHERTLERLHVNLLIGGTANTGFDTNTIFTTGTITALTPAARGNRIGAGSGGGPTATQLSLMRQYGLNQVWNKLNDDQTTYKRIYTGDLAKVLISHHWVETAEQTLFPMAQVGETKVPITDATLNRWRGKAQPIYVPMLNEQSDPKYWYAIFDALQFIVHVFQTGYGRGGKKTVFVNLLTGAVHVKCEGRFGAVIVHPQAGMMNDGQ